MRQLTEREKIMKRIELCEFEQHCGFDCEEDEKRNEKNLIWNINQLETLRVNEEFEKNKHNQTLVFLT